MKYQGRTTSLYHQGKRDRQELERRRFRAAKLFKQGMRNKSEIARQLGVSLEAVRLWYLTWQKKGIKGLKSKGKPGPEPKLTEAKRRKVEKALLKGPQAFGYTTNIWTLARIAEVIKRVVGVSYHPGHLWYVLRSMGWSCQRPKIQSKYRNEEVIRQWKEKTWPAIKKRGSN